MAYDKDSVSGDGNAANLAKHNASKVDAARIDADKRHKVLAPSHRNPDREDAARADLRVRKANAAYHRRELERYLQPKPTLSARQVRKRRSSHR